VKQGERMGMIRYGSQTNLYIGVSDLYDYKFIQEVGTVVKGGIDPVIKVIPKQGRKNKHYNY